MYVYKYIVSNYLKNRSVTLVLRYRFMVRNDAICKILEMLKIKELLSCIQSTFQSFPIQGEPRIQYAVILSLITQRKRTQTRDPTTRHKVR